MAWRVTFRAWVPYLGFRLQLHPRLYSRRRFAAVEICGFGGRSWNGYLSFAPEHTVPCRPLEPLFSSRGEAKCMRGASAQGARRLARGGVLEQYGEHGKQAQRSNGGPIVCFARQAMGNAG